MSRTLLLNIAVGWTEGKPNYEGSEIAKKQVFGYRIVAYCFELDIVINFVGDFIEVI